MGTIGGVVAGIGSLFIFASEATHEREDGRAKRRFLGLNGPEWGAILLIAAFIELTLPALTAFTPITIGSLAVPTFPLILVFAGSGGFAAVTRLTHRPGTATLMAGILWIECLITQAFVPWALLTTVSRFGLNFRYSGRTPHFNLTLALIPLLFLVCGLVLDGVLLLRRNTRSLDTLRSPWLLALMLVVLTIVVPPLIVQVLLAFPAVILPPDVVRVLHIGWLDILVALLPTFLISLASVQFGAFFGDIFYRSRV
jgi:hypothetical protein